jgi:hypothetical protein
MIFECVHDVHQGGPRLLAEKLALEEHALHCQTTYPIYSSDLTASYFRWLRRKTVGRCVGPRFGMRGRGIDMKVCLSWKRCWRGLLSRNWMLPIEKALVSRERNSRIWVSTHARGSRCSLREGSCTQSLSHQWLLLCRQCRRQLRFLRPGKLCEVSRGKRREVVLTWIGISLHFTLTSCDHWRSTTTDQLVIVKWETFRSLNMHCSAFR